MYQQAQNCVHCGQCTRRCAFLKKYNLDLGEYATNPGLAYHCFLCGECRRVCPKGIDGRAISLSLREARAEEGHRPQTDGYGLLLLEKRDYLFKNYRRARGRIALFPGCNFPAYFPGTTRYLSRLLEERAGLGTVYDCCGKPISELGLAGEAAACLHRLDCRLERLGIEELVVLCPNCFYYLRGRIKARVSFITGQLVDLGLAVTADLSDGALFLPCPDRDTEELAGAMEQSLLTGGLARVEDVACCGLGGCAAQKEPRISKEMGQQLAAPGRKVYTYCATCAGSIAAKGGAVEHLLCRFLGHPEAPARGIRSLVNRAKCRFC